MLPAKVRAQRVVDRHRKGPLRQLLIAPRTSKEYTRACRWFFAWLVQECIEIRGSLWEMDQLVCKGIEYLWQSGDTRGMVGNLISGLEHFVTCLHGNLKGSWRLWRAWGRQELPHRAPPLTPAMVWAIAHVLWQWKFADCAALVLLGFDTFLRTGELVAIQRLHVLTGQSEWPSMHVSLPFTKGTARSGGVESVVCRDPLVVAVIHKLLHELSPGDRLLRRTPLQFRNAFRHATNEIGLEAGHTPYSLRRGGATHFFRKCGSMDKTMEAGRWRDSRTARIYVNTALVELGQVELAPEVDRKILNWACDMRDMVQSWK